VSPRCAGEGRPARRHGRLTGGKGGALPPARSEIFIRREAANGARYRYQLRGPFFGRSSSDGRQPTARVTLHDRVELRAVEGRLHEFEDGGFDGEVRRVGTEKNPFEWHAGG
jgi:hypothetical protein